MSFKERMNILWYVFRHPEEASLKIRRFDFLKKTRRKLKSENSDLQSKCANLEQEIPRIKGLVEQARKACLNVHTRRDVIEARAEENQAQNKALHEWQSNYAGPLENRMNYAEEKARVLTGAVFGLAVDTVIKLDSKAKKIPFIFFDSVNKNLIYTPATLKFFGISETEANKITFNGLLRKVERKYLRGEDGKLGIIDAIKSGEKLNHYNAKTLGDNPKELKLTTYPVSYDGKSIGIGILLYDPKISLNSIKNRNFIKNLDLIFYGMVEEMIRVLNEKIPEPFLRHHYNS